MAATNRIADSEPGLTMHRRTFMVGLASALAGAACTRGEPDARSSVAAPAADPPQVATPTSPPTSPPTTPPTTVARTTTLPSTSTTSSSTTTTSTTIPPGSIQLDFRVGITAVHRDPNPMLVGGAADMSRSLSYCNVHFHGWGLDGGRTHPSPGVWDWTDMDARMAAASPAGVEPVITLCGVPLWMRQGDTTGLPITINQTDPWVYHFPHPDHWDDFAAAAAAIADRYRDVRVFQVWNEMKGLWWQDELRWWYEGYLEVYDRVSSAILAVRPDAMIAGPYPVIRTRRFVDPDFSTIGSPDGLHVDTRALDVIDAWLAKGYDPAHHLLSFDLKNTNRDGEPPDRWTAVAATGRWLEHRLVAGGHGGYRTIASEWYARPGSPGASEAERLAIVTWSLIEAAQTGVNDLLLWQMNDDADPHPIGMFRGDGTPTGLVDVLAWFKSHLPGWVLPIDPAGGFIGLSAPDGSRITVDRTTFEVSIT